MSENQKDPQTSEKLSESSESSEKIEEPLNDNDEDPQPLATIDDMLPSELVLYPLGGRPFFPGMLAPVQVEGWPYYDTIVEALKAPGKLFGLVLSREEEGEAVFNPDQLYRMGTVARIMESVVDEKAKQVKLLAEGVSRFEIESILRDKPPLVGRVTHHNSIIEPDHTNDIKPFTMAILNALKEILQYDSLYQEQVKIFLSRHNFGDPDRVADFVASLTTSSREELQEVLETIPIRDRLEKVLLLLQKELEMVKVQSKISKQVEESVSEHQRQFFLREQLKEIQKELGITKDDRTADVERFEERIKELTLTEEAADRIREEMDKLSVLETSSSEYGVTRNYLDWLTGLPWGIHSKDKLNIARARKILDRDHDSLEDVKERIIEFLAVGKLKGEIGGSIICLVGPPGVGKTSIGKSVARAVGRQFYRFSLGGMRDEAEIKGHRRTYIGALPGKFIHAIKYTKKSNPLIMLDEVDKIGSSFHGDPASALLEVLDPEQNTEFLDHYLDVRFDLSNVLFMCTANQLDTIPTPLLDRMEVIRLSGYIAEEKVRIGRNHLIPKQLKKNGLEKKQLRISNGALRVIVDGYAREAGVRHLEKKIGVISRKSAVKILEGEEKLPIRVGQDSVETFLGKPTFLDEKPIKGVGVVTGLAWTAMGGATLDIEAVHVETLSEKKTGAQMKLTGHLGDVMKESAEIAHSVILANASRWGGDPKRLDGLIHLHVPEGATPKDGPSAGISMTSALLSLTRDAPVPKVLAMTGEITLTGRILAVGGVREKVIAARRVGIRELIMPEACRKNYDEIPDYVRDGFTIHFVRHYNEVVKILFP